MSFDPERPGLLINRSVTEWEVKTAVGHETRDVSCTDLCWLHRDFNGGAWVSLIHLSDYAFFYGYFKGFGASNGILNQQKSCCIFRPLSIYHLPA